MNTSVKSFIGIDVSKPYFDASLLSVVNHEKQCIKTERFSNVPNGIKTFGKWLKDHHVTFDANTLIVIENTGIYHRLLWAFCTKKKLQLHIGNAAHIKWSFGIARGKNDIIDSVRLCNYAHKHCDELKAAPFSSVVGIASLSKLIHLTIRKPPPCHRQAGI
jgi:transposase